MTHNALFLMDPLDTVIVEKDTTLMLMLEAHEREQQVWYLPKNGISLDENTLKFHVTRVTPQYDLEKPFIRHESLQLDESEIGSIYIRTDPPFDAQYLMHTWLLDRIETKIPILNRPSGIRSVNEKVWATRFTDLMPPTLISSRINEINTFSSKFDTVIAKPTNGFGGSAVFKVADTDPNRAVIFETLTHNETTEIIVQEFIPEVQNGDKRILLLNGDYLGAIRRVNPDDHRQNFVAGGHPEKTELSNSDHHIIETLSPFLKELGLYFVGIDVIGSQLIEVNVTSPTGLQAVNKMENAKIESKILDFVERLAI